MLNWFSFICIEQFLGLRSALWHERLWRELLWKLLLFTWTVLICYFSKLSLNINTSLCQIFRVTQNWKRGPKGEIPKKCQLHAAYTGHNLIAFHMAPLLKARHTCHEQQATLKQAVQACFQEHFECSRAERTSFSYA